MIVGCKASARRLVALIADLLPVLATPPPPTERQYGRGAWLFGDDDKIRTALMFFWLAAEPLRLAAGYYGNLQENVRSARAAAALGNAPHTLIHLSAAPRNSLPGGDADETRMNQAASSAAADAKRCR